MRQFGSCGQAGLLRWSLGCEGLIRRSANGPKRREGSTTASVAGMMQSGRNATWRSRTDMQQGRRLTINKVLERERWASQRESFRCCNDHVPSCSRATMLMWARNVGTGNDQGRHGAAHLGEAWGVSRPANGMLEPGCRYLSRLTKEERRRSKLESRSALEAILARRHAYMPCANTTRTAGLVMH
jgi:hypothetical protein